jgi:hypothetical protein
MIVAERPSAELRASEVVPYELNEKALAVGAECAAPAAAR